MHLQQVHQHQGLLSHQRGQGDREDRLHQHAQRGRSHRGGLCCLLCQQDQKVQGVQHFPGWGELGPSESIGFRSVMEAVVGPTRLRSRAPDGLCPIPSQTGEVSTTDTYRGPRGTDSASSTRETSSTLEKRTNKQSEGGQPLTWPSRPISKRGLGRALAENHSEVLTGGPALPRAPLGPGAPTLPCRRAQRSHGWASPGSSLPAARGLDGEILTMGPGGPVGPAVPGAPASPLAPASPGSPLAPGWPSAPWGRRECGEWRRGLCRPRKSAEEGQELQAGRCLNGRQFPLHPPSLNQANASLLIQSLKAPGPSWRWKMKGILVLTGGPAKPAGPGGPGSPRSP